ncbi:MAG: hypothetical protein MPJ24_05595 [Pirellulaceae bacterium]|nr:hypothetical protein [Pirellulaceae bacterium]
MSLIYRYGLYLPVSFVFFLTSFLETSYAHPGHGDGGGSHSPVHYLTEPVHAGATALLIVVLVVGFLYSQQILSQKSRKNTPSKR